MYIFRKKRYIVSMLLPVLLVYCIYVIFPTIFSFYYSFTSYTGIGNPSLIGLKNYATLFQKDFIFGIALKNNLLIVALTLVIEIGLAFLLALLLSASFKGNNMVKAMIYSPHIIAPIMIGLMWIFILDPTKGVLNSLLDMLGLGALKQKWIGGVTWTPYSVTAVCVWNSLGFYTTVYMAGLAAISDDVYEAASIDGANAFHRILYITIPLVRETTVMIMVLIITNGFRIYEIVMQLTNGGPSHQSEVLVNYMYQTTFTNSRYGYGMSIAVATFLVSCAFSFLYLNAVKRDGKKGGKD